MTRCICKSGLITLIRICLSYNFPRLYWYFMVVFSKWEKIGGERDDAKILACVSCTWLHIYTGSKNTAAENGARICVCRCVNVCAYKPRAIHYNTPSFVRWKHKTYSGDKSQRFSRLAQADFSELVEGRSWRDASMGERVSRRRIATRDQQSVSYILKFSALGPVRETATKQRQPVTRSSSLLLPWHVPLNASLEREKIELDRVEWEQSEETMGWQGFGKRFSNKMDER